MEPVPVVSLKWRTFYCQKGLIFKREAELVAKLATALDALYGSRTLDPGTILSCSRGVCGNAARTVLCGGRSVMIVPTATVR